MASKPELNSPPIRELVDMTMVFQSYLRSAPQWKPDLTRPNHLGEHDAYQVHSHLRHWIRTMLAAWPAMQRAGDKMNRKNDPAAIRWDVKVAAIINRMLLHMGIADPTQIDQTFHLNLALRARTSSSDIADELKSQAMALLDLALALDIAEKRKAGKDIKPGIKLTETDKRIKREIDTRPRRTSDEIAKSARTTAENVRRVVGKKLAPLGYTGGTKGYCPPAVTSDAPADAPK